MRALLLLLCPLLSALLVAADPPGSGDWKYDVVYRKQGDPLRGLVLDQSDRSVKIRCISRKRGAATLVMTAVVPRDEVARVELLPAEERKQLEERLEALKKEREVLLEHLRALDPASNKAGPRSHDQVSLEPAAWPGDAKATAVSYQSTYFTLLANTPPELAQLAAIHLEQIYDAYARALPARTLTRDKTTILLTASQAEYQALAKRRGLNLFNPAYYDPEKNQVVCGSDLARLRDELEKVRAHHARTRATMKERREELTKLYRGRVPPELLTPMQDAEKQIVLSEKRNNEKFAGARARLFQRLYHEAFHAYLGTFVYPAKDGSVPVWFNEGLAQVFETAVAEVGELRVGVPDPPRWKAMRQALAQGTMLPVAELLRAGPKQFQVAHASEQQASDRTYLAAWALAFHLTFEQKLLGTRKLDAYVLALERGGEPVAAFQELVGKPIAAFEAEYRAYLEGLKEDGTTAKKTP